MDSVEELDGFIEQRLADCEHQLSKKEVIFEMLEEYQGHIKRLQELQIALLAKL